jgi:hypothetical protein
MQQCNAGPWEEFAMIFLCALLGLACFALLWAFVPFCERL